MVNWKKGCITIILSPIAFIYWIGVSFRHFLFDVGALKSVSFSIPVICVGNITVGGTGKTPHIEYLIRLLKSEYRIAVLSRGYKRKTKNFIRADEHCHAEEIGDEPCQLKRKFPEIEVVVERDRVFGVAQLTKEVENLEVVFLDDGFQHRYIKPELNILLIDYNHPILKDLLLPAGRLRDTTKQRKRADIIIISKCPPDITKAEKVEWGEKYLVKSGQHIFFSSIEYGDLIPLDPAEKALKISSIPGANTSILLLTGIAHPGPLKKYLLLYTERLQSMVFPDHHTYSQKDIKKLANVYERMGDGNKIIITSEKDSVRLEMFSKKLTELNLPVYYIPIQVRFLFEEQKKLDALIREYCRVSKHASISDG